MYIFKNHNHCRFYLQTSSWVFFRIERERERRGKERERREKVRKKEKR
jgi:hypothetical protein